MRAAVWIGAAFLAAAGTGGTAHGRAPAPKMNVLFIAVDDLNDWIGPVKGYPGLRTPNFDRLARRGITFTRAYCAAPACNPSRTALLVGRHPASTGVYLNSQPWRPVLRDAVTLPQHFRAHGYEVAAGSKLFHNSFNDPASWDTYFREPRNPSPERVPANGIPRTAQFDWGPVDVPDDAMGDSQLVSWAGDFLQREHQKPFFLGVGLIRPHLPWYVPRKYFDMYPLSTIRLPEVKPDDLADVPPAGRRMAGPDRDHRRVVETDNWKKAVQGYMASITFADDCVGRLLDSLDRSPHAKNTAIVFWGDHGWHLGEKEHWRKFALWEEATRTPLIITTPDRRGAGKKCSRVVGLLDLYRTMIDLCGLTPRADIEGRSLAPLLKRPDTRWPYAVVTTHGRRSHAVRVEGWRYIRYADGTEELYDHRSDPREWTNLAGRPEHAKIKEALALWLPHADAADAPRQAGSGGE